MCFILTELWARIYYELQNYLGGNFEKIYIKIFIIRNFGIKDFSRTWRVYFLINQFLMKNNMYEISFKEGTVILGDFMTRGKSL